MSDLTALREQASRVLARETFEEFRIGEFPFDYTAMGEYHYYSPAGFRGRWYELTNHSSWRPGPAWRVTEEDGDHCMEAVPPTGEGYPMLVTGDPAWRDYLVELDVRPLALTGSAGLAFRYRDSRSFYALLLSEGSRLRLIHHTHAGIRTIVETDFAYDVDTYHWLSVWARGDRFTCFADGVEVFEAADSTLAEGRCALYATAPARFDDLTVRATPEVRAAFAHMNRGRERELADLRERYPQPELWRVIHTPGFGSGRHIRFGDLNGDGRLELVVAQNLKHYPNDNYAMPSCLTALDLDGNTLWQIGEPSLNPERTILTADVPFQIHDLDGDGKEEVVFCKDFQLQVVDGATGALKMRIPTPEAPLGGPRAEDRFHRVCGDSLFFCDLRGQGRAGDLLLKSRYNQVWAYDTDLNLLWTHRGNTGHYFAACDIDGDGRDEVQSGYTLLSPDGVPLWTTDLGDHVDEIVIGRIDPANPEPQIAVVAGAAGFIIFDPRGNILRQHIIGHAQRVSAARYRPDLPGLQYWTSTYWGNPGILSLFDCRGDLLHTFEPANTGNILSPVNWTGDGTEQALLTASTRHGGLMDGHGRRVVLFPDDGHPEMCAEALDLYGDGRDELVVWDPGRIFIYTQSTPAPAGPIFQPERLPHYNCSNYRGEISHPCEPQRIV